PSPGFSARYRFSRRMTAMPFPFEVPVEQLRSDIRTYVDQMFSCLQSEFLTLPKGPGFVEYPVFERGYENLKKAMGDFRKVTSEIVLDAIDRVPVAFIVLRAMLGFTPPEWAYVTTQRAEVEVTQGAMKKLLLATRGKVFTL